MRVMARVAATKQHDGLSVADHLVAATALHHRLTIRHEDADAEVETPERMDLKLGGGQDFVVLLIAARNVERRFGTHVTGPPVWAAGWSSPSPSAAPAVSSHRSLCRRHITSKMIRPRASHRPSISGA